MLKLPIYVEVTQQDDSLVYFLGIGVNVSNGRPTVCLDRIIEDFNLENGTCLKPLSIERLIGLIMTNVERLLQMFQGDGYEEFCKIYYNYWLHRLV